MFLALKELKHGKLRFLMIGTILVLISWLVFILSGLGNGLSTLSAASLKGMDTDYVVYEKGSSNALSKSLLSEDLTTRIKEENSDVKAAAPIGASMGSVVKDGEDLDGDKEDVAILGIEPGTFLEPKVIEGSSLSSGEPMKVIANDTLKDAGFKIGDVLQLDGSTEEMEIAGFVEDQTYNHVTSIYVTMEKWRDYTFAAPGSDNGIENPVNGIALQGENIDAEKLDSQIDGIQTATKKQAINGMPGYTAENGTITMMLVFLLAISAFVIAVFFYVLTLQKSNQFGIMKAIGASNGFLAKAIVSQVFTLSLISILIGIALSYGTAAILPEAMPFNLDTVLVITYGVVLLIISVLSSLLSVRKITKIDPLTAIGRVE
ncbi:ABC transporter permease [Bacillus sp. AGMB 02131]|uniref:Putative hemin transport system permease protein HrtB n=1 Tax=Peribacillus faecalis TaxID=2772559 RepID=A0A927CWJ6_9BACI|nr:ABC transporter permease [Peribacillus faecalis]MBD3109083.1 ABC transporter permease [Peribacillus faecalis]